MSRLQGLFQTDKIDPESRNRFLLVSGMVLVVLFALVLVAVGYYVDRIAPRGDPVVIVADREFSYSYVEDRVHAAFREGTFDISNPAFSIGVIVSNIQNEELTRLIAKEEGVSISREELDVALREDLGLPADMPRNTFASELANRLKEVDLSLERYEEVIEAHALEDKLTSRYAETIPAELEQAEISLILVQTDAAAVAARQRIVDGEDFGEVATSVSEDQSASVGGALGWTPRELLQDELGDAIFALEPNTLSDVIETSRGFYIVQINGKEVRPVDEQQKINLSRTAFDRRLDEADEKYQPQNLLTVGQAQDMIRNLGG